MAGRDALKYKVIVPPAVEPVVLDELLRQLRYDDPDEELSQTLRELITASREVCEEYQNRAYITQTLELALDRWPCGNGIDLPRPPLQSVTSVTYIDADGDSHTWAASNYLVDDYSFVARLVRKTPWPTDRLAEANGIRIRYVAGYPPIEGDEITGQALGTGDGEEQTYTVGSVEPDSETVYFDGTPTDAYTIDYSTGTIVCEPEEAVAVTIDYTKPSDYAGNVPRRIKQAIILHATELFDSPGCPPSASVKALLDYDRVVLI